MKTNEQCLPVDLQSWLLHPDSEKEGERWSQHLEQCQDCRSRVEEQLPALAWSKILTEDAWDHELSSSHDVANKLAQSNAIDHAALEKFAKQVIDKSDNPAMLGRLGEFEILEPIGMGGMSLVLKGYDHELNRFVAIKVLAPHLAMVGVARQRFAREAQAAASIVDPHVVPIHSVAADHDPPYLVMTYVPGQTLQATIDTQGSLDVLVSVRIAYQVAMGLAAAHAQGLVHRDIKPSNILLERNVQKAFIADFGLARAADDASLTRSGFLAGTPDYMSPEQARGESIDARSDLFSLGSVLYTMLTGHPPFRASSPMAVLNRISQDKPRPIIACNPQVPIWLSSFVDRLLSKFPDDRFASASETATLLEAALRHLQDPTGCPLPNILETPVPRTKYMAKHLAKRFTIAGLVLLCSIASWVCLSYWRPDASVSRMKTNSSQVIANGLSKNSEASIPDPLQPAAAGADDEWIAQHDAIEMEIASWERWMRNAVSESSDDSSMESSMESIKDAVKTKTENTNESTDRELIDGINAFEQQFDRWLQEINTKGKS